MVVVAMMVVAKMSSSGTRTALSLSFNHTPTTSSSSSSSLTNLLAHLFFKLKKLQKPTLVLVVLPRLKTALAPEPAPALVRGGM
jgi:hypothetical protein